jgi:hypothetical protein
MRAWSKKQFSLESIRRIRRDQRAVSFASRAAGRSYASRPRPFSFANRALVTSGLPQCAAMSGGLPSAARRRDVALRLRFAKRFSPPSAPISPLTDRRPKPGFIAELGGVTPDEISLVVLKCPCAANFHRQCGFLVQRSAIFLHEHFAAQAFQRKVRQRVLLRVQRINSDLTIGVFCLRETPGIRVLRLSRTWPSQTPAT